MKKQTKERVRQLVSKEVDKLFELYFEGTEGWIYSKQSRWSSNDVFQRLIQANLEKTSIEDVCLDFAGCSADTVHYRMKNLEFDPSVQHVNNSLRYIAQGFQIHKNTKITVAVDITDHPFYGDRDHELSVGSKEKAGTYFFNRYFTACIITDGYRFPIFFRPIRQEDGVSPLYLLEEFFREVLWWCPIRRVLADAWFFSAEVLDLLDRYQLEHIIPLKKTKSVKRSIETIKTTLEGMAAVAGIDITQSKKFFRWLKKNNLLTFKFELELTSCHNRRYPVIVQAQLLKVKKGRKPERVYLDFYVYTTNIRGSADYIEKIYRSRWGIETQYRVVHQFQARTTSLNSILRLLLIGIGFILEAIWLRINAFLHIVTHVLKVTCNYELPIKIYKISTLILTVSRFKRLLQALWRPNERS
jgi:putative transposase